MTEGGGVRQGEKLPLFSSSQGFSQHFKGPLIRAL